MTSLDNKYQEDYKDISAGKPITDMVQPMMKVSKYAKLKCLSTDTVRRWIKTGQLEGKKDAKNRFVTLKDDFNTENPNKLDV